jgi:cephalosporin hydroxylase
MIKVDMEKGVVSVEQQGMNRDYKLDTPEAFRIISEIWLRSGWDNKYVYTFTWLGRPIIQLPEDMIRLQEVIHSMCPDVIIETGVAHGGSLVFYASLCKAMNRGRVIGIDIEIRPHNREAIEAHPLVVHNADRRQLDRSRHRGKSAVSNRAKRESTGLTGFVSYERARAR